eukprot:4623043-Pleurochrysis_carterae.AAC.1
MRPPIALALSRSLMRTCTPASEQAIARTPTRASARSYALPRAQSRAHQRAPCARASGAPVYARARVDAKHSAQRLHAPAAR